MFKLPPSGTASMAALNRPDASDLMEEVAICLPSAVSAMMDWPCWKTYTSEFSVSGNSITGIRLSSVSLYRKSSPEALLTSAAKRINPIIRSISNPSRCFFGSSHGSRDRLAGHTSYKYCYSGRCCYSQERRREMVCHSPGQSRTIILSVFCAFCGEPLCSDPTTEAQRNKRPYSLPGLTHIIQRRANNYKSLKDKIAKLHKRINCQRDDFLHKLSRMYVNNFDVICVEDLDGKGLKEKRLLLLEINLSIS